MSTVNVTLDMRQLGTVLASLRLWQLRLEGMRRHGFPEIDDIATDGGEQDALTLEEVDALCGQLNCQPPLWERNDVQFPRLLSEIDMVALLTDVQYEALSLSMDLSRGEINDLLQRADEEWDRLKTLIPVLVPPRDRPAE